MIFLRFLLFFCFVSPAFAAVEPALLSEQTLKRFELVPEFEFIIQEANKLGVKVYLFGGTASAFAHYVRWDLEREAGDNKYQKERFDYDFTNIYRGNQDLDIVVDGTPKQADQLKRILQKAYPHFVGDRDAWEVRLLKESRGDKRALIGDEDFKKQHSDTNSTGMLLLNPDPQGIVYNDLLNWDSHESDFLNDVAAARIKFLYSDEHEETQRFKDGKNPPVLAAIRYLAKLAQYEVKGTAKDLEIVTRIIRETNFNNLSEYGKKKVEEFALKTLLNAPDSEYAWNLLDKTGARSKLIEMDSNQINRKDTLSWWMNKEPLRSYDLGKTGERARDIFGDGEIIVSHETNNFHAYDNITRSSQGGANAFISRSGVVGEAAVHGDGFYTRRGLEGARGTGLTIRFKLHPEAREGVDFERAYDFIIVKNKKALTLIQENLNLSLIDFLKLLLLNQLGENEKGIKEKLMRKFNRVSVDSEEFKKAVEFAKDLFSISEDFPYPFESYAFEVNSFSELFDLVNETRSSYYKETIKPLLSKEELWKDRPDRVIKLIEQNILIDSVLKEIFSQEWVINYPELIEYVTNLPDPEIKRKLAVFVFSQPAWKDQKDLFSSLFLEVEQEDQLFLIFYVYSQGFFKDVLKEHYHENYFTQDITDIVNSILSGEVKSPDQFMPQVIAELGKVFYFKIISIYPEFWARFPWILYDKIEKTNTNNYNEIIYILRLPGWGKNPELIEKLLALEDNIIDKALITLLAQEQWSFYPKFVETLLDFRNLNIQDFKIQRTLEIITEILSREHWLIYPDLVLKVLKVNEELKDPDINVYLVRSVFPKVFSQEHVDMMKDLVKKDVGKIQDEKSEDEFLHLEIIEQVLTQKAWFDQPDIVNELIKKNKPHIDFELMKHVLTQPYAAKYDWADTILNRIPEGDEFEKDFINYLYHLDHWSPKVQSWFDQIYEEGDDEYILAALETKHDLKNRAALVQELVDKYLNGELGIEARDFFNILVDDEGLLDISFSKPEWIEEFINNGQDDYALVEQILSMPDWQKKYPDRVRKWIQTIIDRGSADEAIYEYILKEEYGKNELEWFAAIMSRLDKWYSGSEKTLEYHFKNSLKHWEDHPKVQAFLSRGGLGRAFTPSVFQSGFETFEEWLQKSKESHSSAPSCKSFLEDDWSGLIETLKKMIQPQ